jgi:hypothetical protein
MRPRNHAIDAQIDDVRVRSVGLADSEVLELYNEN